MRIADPSSTPAPKNAIASGSQLYAARADGLWRRATGDVSVPADGGAVALRFGLAGPQPARDQVRFRFDLPATGNASIDVFDVAGRRAAVPIRGSWSAGPHEVTWDASDLTPGVYEARLTAVGRQEFIRLAHVH